MTEVDKPSITISEEETKAATTNSVSEEETKAATFATNDERSAAYKEFRLEDF